MGFGRIGGMLVVGGCVLFVVTGAIFVVGGTLHIGDGEIGSLALAASLALVAFGAAVLSVTGPRPLNGRAVRVGLGILAVGLLSSLASSAIAAGLTYDPLEDGPFVILFLVGGLATIIGSPVTVLSLVRAGGRPRAVGSLFLAGLLLVILGGLLGAGTNPNPDPLPVIGRALAVLGALVIVLGGTGVGVLAINGSRSAPVASR
jgi:hypothetical protein